MRSSGAVDGRHALERPVAGEAADVVVDLGLVVAHPAHQVGGEAIGLDGQVGQHLGRLAALGLGLVEERQRPLPRLRRLPSGPHRPARPSRQPG